MRSDIVKGKLPKPSAEQLAFQQLELGLFIHFGMNTYTGESSGSGLHPPQLFNPEGLDCDNWMLMAKEMGARFAVLTTRHEEGFCLWPTRTTDYQIAGSPYRAGQGDIVQEFVQACRRHGIKPCLYHPSYMDARHTFKEDDPIGWHREWFASMRRRLAEPGVAERFTAMQVEQVRELLSEYGEITYLWLDHIGETQGILDPKAVQAFWSEIVAEARRCQPQCLLLKEDIFLSRDTAAGTGVHAGRAAYPLWHACRREDEADGLSNPLPDPVNGTEYVVWESNTSFSGNWFWNGGAVVPVDKMMEHYYATVGRGAMLLANFAPDPSGCMTAEVLEHARQFGQQIKTIYAAPLAVIEPGQGGERASCDTFELELPAEPFTHLEIMEDLQEGQRIAAYSIEVRRQGMWSELLSGLSVGHKRLHKLSPQRAEAIRFRCVSSVAPEIRLKRFAVYA